jgi:iron complex transport system permease protein
MRLSLLLIVLLVVVLALGVLLGETPLSAAQIMQAFSDPASPPGEVLWTIRAPRAATAAVVGAGLGCGWRGAGAGRRGDAGTVAQSAG